jgi:hypothetical protein
MDKNCFGNEIRENDAFERIEILCIQKTLLINSIAIPKGSISLFKIYILGSVETILSLSHQSFVRV